MVDHHRRKLNMRSLHVWISNIQILGQTQPTWWHNSARLSPGR